MSEWDTEAMTDTPVPTDLLVSNADLAAWAQEDEATTAASDLAQQCRYWATVQVRTYGSSTWTASTIPERARMIAVLIAKNAYLNPANKSSEGLAVFRDGFREADFTVSEEYQQELAALASGIPLNPLGAPGEGWGDFTVMRFAEPAQNRRDFYVRDTLGGDWSIPWYNSEQIPHGEAPVDMSSTYFHTLVVQTNVQPYMVLKHDGTILDRASHDDAYAQPFIVVQAGIVGQRVRALVGGVLINPGWSLLPGHALWIGDGGLLTQDKPSMLTGWVRMIGTAVSETAAWIAVAPPETQSVPGSGVQNSWRFEQVEPRMVWSVQLPPGQFDRQPVVAVYVEGREVMADVDVSGWESGEVFVSLPVEAAGTVVLG